MSHWCVVKPSYLLFLSWCVLPCGELEYKMAPVAWRFDISLIFQVCLMYGVILYNLMQELYFQEAALRHIDEALKQGIWGRKTTCEPLHNPAVRAEKIPQSWLGNRSSHKQQLPEVFLGFAAAGCVSSLTAEASDGAPFSCGDLLSTTAPHHGDTTIPASRLGSTLRTRQPGHVNMLLEPVKAQLP